MYVPHSQTYKAEDVENNQFDCPCRDPRVLPPVSGMCERAVGAIRWRYRVTVPERSSVGDGSERADNAGSDCEADVGYHGMHDEDDDDDEEVQSLD